jgi:hypothetical protein
MDEHRIGLKPITRGVWAPKGERPIALGHHRYEWLYVHGFVEPASGRTVWNVSNAVCKEMFEAILADFAKSIGIGNKKSAVLQLDGAGWHGPENLVVPEGIRLVFQPSHSPELQPAEHLWHSSTSRSPTHTSRLSKTSISSSASAASNSWNSKI